MKLTDAVIMDVIKELRERQIPIRGSTIRRELLARFGSPAGTDRVYRLIRESEVEEVESHLHVLEDDLRSAQGQVQREQERAALAEYREQSHFDKWAGEIYELRKKVASFESSIGARSRIESEKERLRLLMELTRAKTTVKQLTELLESHGIAVPKTIEE